MAQSNSRRLHCTASAYGDSRQTQLAASTVQGDYLPEHKIAPEWQQYLAEPRQLQEDVTLAVSFPLLHDASRGEDQQGPLLSPSYDPGSAAEAVWQQELARAGISADVSRRNQHLVTVTIAPETVLVESGLKEAEKVVYASCSLAGSG